MQVIFLELNSWQSQASLERDSSSCVHVPQNTSHKDFHVVIASVTAQEWTKIVLQVQIVALFTQPSTFHRS